MTRCPTTPWVRGAMTSPLQAVLSVRFTADQYDRLAAIAAAGDLPVSTMAILAILAILATLATLATLDQQGRDPASGPIDLTAVTAALREVIRPEFLKAG